MSWDCVSDTVCPIARALSVVGDRWTLLILRELIMGNNRFDEIQAQTGISSHLLSSRLKRLESEGVIERKLYSERPPRYEYQRTAKGKDLDPVILLLRQWGMKHGGYEPKEEPAMRVVHRKTGQLVDANWRMPEEGRRFTFDDVDAKIGKVFRAEREEKRAAFRASKGLSD
jgi:DNA-binding HxlR family transcriptional regulator